LESRGARSAIDLTVNLVRLIIMIVVRKSKTSNVRVGVVGVGKMGNPIASHISRSPFKVWYYDTDPKAIGPGERLRSCREVSERTDVILVIVGTDDDVKNCFAGPQGLLAGSVKGKVFVILSTVSPQTLGKIRASVIRRGAKLLDAPVVWGEQGAIEGNLVTYVGGDRQAFHKCQQVLAAYSKEVFYLGPSGSGLIAKTANNHLMWTCRFANLEVLQLASHYYAGDIKILLRALLAGTGSNACLARISSPSGGAPWAEKDLEIVVKMARDSSLQPLFAKAAQLAVCNQDYLKFNDQGIKWLIKSKIAHTSRRRGTASVGMKSEIS
jgi:3-hydroxyisobutyrate dehydrogenase-like beta-hydroxyacid dehydrogenase